MRARNSEKIECVTTFPVPTDVHSVRQFLGLASYFRKYVNKFALIDKLLTKLTKKNCTFSWGDDQQHAFDKLMQKLTTRPTLAISDREAIT